MALENHLSISSSGVWHTGFSLLLFNQKGVLARALKINIKIEMYISEQAAHDLLWSRSIFLAPILGSNVPSFQVPISKLGLC